MCEARHSRSVTCNVLLEQTARRTLLDLILLSARLAFEAGCPTSLIYSDTVLLVTGVKRATAPPVHGRLQLWHFRVAPTGATTGTTGHRLTPRMRWPPATKTESAASVHERPRDRRHTRGLAVSDNATGPLSPTQPLPASEVTTKVPPDAAHHSTRPSLNQQRSGLHAGSLANSGVPAYARCVRS
jgi:hypothetical protein